MRYLDDAAPMTLTDIGRTLGVTRHSVREIETQAFASSPGAPTSSACGRLSSRPRGSR